MYKLNCSPKCLVILQRTNMTLQPVKTKIAVLIFVIMCCGFDIASQTFSTQAQLDAWDPSLTDIAGSVLIINNDITNIDALSNIQTISGTLTINHSNSLKDVNGLSGLRSIEGTLNIQSSAIENLDGLNGLTSIDGSLWLIKMENLRDIGGLSNVKSIDGWLVLNDIAIENVNSLSNVTSISGKEGVGLSIVNNDKLLQIDGLSNLTSLEGSMYIQHNEKLQHIDGLSNLTSISKTLLIWGNNLITDIDGLSNLTSISGELRLRENIGLTNINGLSNLSTLDGSIYIKRNSSLISIEGLSNLKASTGLINIENNELLSDCCVLLPLIEPRQQGAISIINNADGCQSIDQILDSMCGPAQSDMCTADDLIIACNQSNNEIELDNWNQANLSKIMACALLNCDSPVVISDYDYSNLNSHCGVAGNFITTYNITGCGSSVELTASILVEDHTVPVVTCEPDDVLAECAASSNQTIVDAWNAANIAKLQGCSIDDCSQNDIVISSDYDFTNFVFGCGSIGSITVSYTITDDCGNNVTKQATFSISDTTPPVVSCLPDDFDYDCRNGIDQNISDAWNQANIAKLLACSSDVCSETIAVTSDYDYNVLLDLCSKNSEVTVSYVVEDECGNTLETRVILEFEDENEGDSFIDLSLDKRVSKDTPEIGEAISFFIDVVNDGPDDATNISINDLLPSGYANVVNISNDGTQSSNIISWDDLDIAVGESITLSFDVEVLDRSDRNDYKNIAEIVSAEELDVDSTPGNDDGDQSEDDEDYEFVFPINRGGCDLVDLELECDDLDDVEIIEKWIDDNNQIALSCSCNEATEVINDFDIDEAYSAGALVKFEVLGCDDSYIFEAQILHQSLFISGLMACFPEDYSNVYECDDGDFENLAIEWNDQNIARLRDCYKEDFPEIEITVASDFELENIASVDCGKNVSIEVVYTVTDVCGYSEESVVTFSTIDTSPPIHCALSALDIECTTGTDIIDEIKVWHEANLSTLEECSSDGCSDILTITSDYDLSSFICDGNGLIITYKLIDECGNYTDLYGDVIVTDEEDDTGGCNVKGGILNTLETQLTEITICIAEGLSKAVYTQVRESDGDNSTFIVTDVENNILRITSDTRIEFDDLKDDAYYIYHISSGEDVTGLSLGSNIYQLMGCYELSNAITVNTIIEGAECDCPMIVSLGDSPTICRDDEVILEATVMNSSVCNIVCSELNSETLVEWNMDACFSVTNGVDNTDFSELTPSYPSEDTCVNISATPVNVEGGAHSCTIPKEGLEGRAMCFTSSKRCYWHDDSPDALKFSVTLTPDNSSTITGLQFYESAPKRFTWYNPDFSEDIDEGPNNFPRFYGIRVLKNGEEIYQQHDIPTTNDWTLEEFDFGENEAFKVEDSTTFVFELLAYCPDWRNAITYAWDLDNIKLLGGCCDRDTTITAVDYLWSTGETSESISVSPTEDTEYTVTVTDCMGCTSTKTLPVMVNEPIAADLGGNISVCIEDLPITLSQSTDIISTPNPRVEWSTGEEGESIQITEAGTYSVTVYDGLACSDTDEIVVSINIPEELNFPEIENLVCAGSTLELSTLEPAGQTGGIWTNTNGEAVANVGAGTFEYTYLDNNGCAVRGQVIILEDNFSISIDDQGPICEG